MTQNQSWLVINATYWWFPNSNLPGPLRSKCPQIHVGMLPVMVVGMGSGVSSTLRNNGAMFWSAWIFLNELFCTLLTTEGRESNIVIYSNNHPVRLKIKHFTLNFDSFIYYTLFCYSISSLLQIKTTCNLQWLASLQWIVTNVLWFNNII